MIYRPFSVQDSIDEMCDWTHDFVINRAKKDGVILGYSGGIDSAICCEIARKALGNHNVHLFALPIDSHPDSLLHASMQAKQSKMDLVRVKDLNGILEGFENSVLDTTCLNSLKDLTLGNIKARIRMVWQYAYAQENNLLVMGTENKTENLVGFFTKYGDSGVDFNILTPYYKTEVFELARNLDIIPEILNKKPTADLWDGQTDEGEMGISYPVLDACLCSLNNEPNVSGAEFTPEHLEHVKKMVANSQHKRDSIPFCPRG